jgi:Tfp pilus assembly protein PilO
MRRNELTIGVAVVVIALAVGFWLLVLGPKRQEASALKDDVSALESELAQAQEQAAAGQQAKKSFPVDYRKLVVLGKAVPKDADQSSLLVQLQKLADRSGVEFQSIDLSESSNSSTTAATTTSTTESTTSSESSSSESESSSSSTESSSSTPAAEPVADATEASAATLPIGAAVGPAGLPVMPYQLNFVGDFFEIADFMKRVDSMVRAGHGGVAVDGRLLTVDAFTLSPVVDEGSSNGAPTLTAELTVTTYLTPADQGATAGATPGGPAPATSTSDTATPASSTGSASATPTPTSSTSP